MTNHRKALIFGLGMLALPWLLIYLGDIRSERILWLLQAPLLAVTTMCRHCYLGNTLASLLGFLVGSIVTFFLWYGVARLWLRSSRHFKFSIYGVGVLALLGAWALHLYANRVDWTSRGLNPNRPGFKPQVVILAGTYHGKRGTALFEIRMRGFDYYYCRRWSGNEWKAGSWFRVELAMKDFSQGWGLTYLPGAIHGGGGSWFGTKDLILARRLWSGDQFVGANTNTLDVEDLHWRREEEFSKLMKFGPYMIPRKITFTEREEGEEIYTIRKVEFDSKPTEDWFTKIKQKYFDRNPVMMEADLDEPGVGPRRR